MDAKIIIWRDVGLPKSVSSINGCSNLGNG